MTDFLKMDVFFVVTTIAVVVVAALMSYLLWRVSRILEHIEHISEQVALEADAIRDDLALVRADIRRGKGKLQSFVELFGKIYKRPKKRGSNLDK
ncbi:MAG: hypothetical protein JWN18_458 [Parcubacteria group bacterium]|nr:hypothetical protein [Parcubacteria group bacterium]